MKKRISDLCIIEGFKLKITEFLQIGVPCLWTGLLIAIAAEAYLKFQAPGITLPLGLGIGRLVFGFLNRAELVCAVIICISFWIKPNSSTVIAIYAIILVMLLVQTFIFLPALDQRALMVIEGKPRVESNIHIYYIICEILKIILLPIMSYLILKYSFKF